jgi:beta-lactamase class A
MPREQGEYDGIQALIEDAWVTITIRPRRNYLSQLYFDNALTDKVHALAPYASRGQRIVKNDMDSIYLRGGSQLMLAVREEGGGLNATFEVGVHAG